MPKTLKQFGEFLSTKKVGFGCPSCGHEEWNVEGDDSDEGLRVVEAPIFDPDYKPDFFQGPRESMRFYVMTCRNCGYARMHNATVVDSHE
jgi:predicted nucleic-acid-binding Zn-ribbon protein